MAGAVNNIFTDLQSERLKETILDIASSSQIMYDFVEDLSKNPIDITSERDS